MLIALPATFLWLVLMMLPMQDVQMQDVQTAPTLADLAFMSGCWEGTFGDEQGSGTIEEHYTTPSDNVMLGTTRYLREHRTVQYEFALIAQDSTGIRLIPYPNGQQSEAVFRLTSIEGAAVVFEAPSHDYPKRILYRRDALGTLVARIDGGADASDAREWSMSPAPCF